MPTSILAFEGKRSHHAINNREPKPLAVRPKCPTYLDEAGQKEWKRLMPILVRMKVVTEADGIALANLCQAYSTKTKAQEQLNKAGILYKTKSGYVQQSPLLGIVNSQIDIINRLCREFGLTPSSRSRIVTGQDDEQRGDTFLD